MSQECYLNSLRVTDYKGHESKGHGEGGAPNQHFRWWRYDRAVHRKTPCTSRSSPSYRNRWIPMVTATA